MKIMRIVKAVSLLSGLALIIIGLAAIYYGGPASIFIFLLLALGIYNVYASIYIHRTGNLPPGYRRDGSALFRDKRFLLLFILSFIFGFLLALMIS